MALQIIALVISCSALLAAVWSVHETLRQDAGLRAYVASARSALDEAASGSRATVQAMAEEVEHLIVRAREERARADGRKGGRPPKDSAPPAENGLDPNMTERQYLALVERTGRSIPELEKRFYG